MASNSATQTPPAPQSDKPKKFWDSILTSTPIVLTVVATLLAGLSSSEMTRAQYHRSLAAQHQSKAGDQWSFFQAKRIRGGNTEMEVELLRTQHLLAPASAEAIAEYAARLPDDLNRTARVGQRMLQALGRIKTSDGSQTPNATIEKLVQVARENAVQAAALQKRIAEGLASAEVRDAFSYLNTDQLPKVTKETVGGPSIREVHEAINSRQTEAETAPLIARISDEELRQALDTAEANAKAFDDAAKPIDKQLGGVAQFVHEATALTGAVHHHAERAMLALAELTANENGEVRTDGTGDAANEIRDAAAALVRIDAALTKNADEVSQSFVASRRDFTARRLEREARDIQEVGGVYEIQVRKSSWDSERHRKRSMLFFIGMLIAQAGVTIATFSLALRQRSVLWVLATVAGLAAISFSAYVYLFT